ncbi:MAG TPA: sigma-70 family RNA polymerase sigma factor [Streptomyces sp.]
MTTFFAHDRPRTAEPGDGSKLEDLEDLVQRASKEMRQHGPGPDTARLFALMRRPLIRYCTARIGPDRAEDVAQETWAGVLRALRTYPARPPFAFAAFVNGVARHKAIDACRAHGRVARRELLVEGVPDAAGGQRGPEELALASELRRALEHAMSVLPRTQRTVLELRVVRGFSVADTAHAIGSTPESVRVMQHRALRRLRVMQHRALRRLRAMPAFAAAAPEAQ